MSNPDLKTEGFAPTLVDPPPGSNKGAIAHEAIGRTTQPGNKPISGSDLKLFAQSAGKIASQNLQRTPAFGKLYEYGGRDINSNSFERYYAYGNISNKLGFNPYRDNEALYLANTSTFADFGRMMRYSFPRLAAAGVVDAVTSIPQTFSNLTGKPVGDLDQARRYAKASDIGYSSRAGIGASASNIIMSGAYTMGMLAETAGEFALASLLATFTGGSSYVTAAASAATKVSKIGRFAQMAGKTFKAAVPRVDQLFKSATNTVKAVKTLNNWNVSKQFWTAAATNSLKFFNPLQGTFDAVKTLRTSKGLGGMAIASKSAGQFYGNIKEITSAASESNLEAGFVKDEIFNDEYEKFMIENRRAPNDEDLNRLIEVAQRGATRTYLQNLGTIFYSNRLTFGKIFKPIPRLNKFLTAEDYISIGAGKLVKDKSKDTAGLILTKYVENGSRASLKEAIKARRLTKTLVNGFLVNVNEGLQENLQEAFSKANTDYYRYVYNNPNNKSGMLYSTAMMDGLKSQLSGQGLETFISGFLMGPLVGSVRKSVIFGVNNIKNIRNKEALQNYKKLSRKLGEEFSKKINDELKNNLSVYLDPRVLHASELELLDTEVNLSTEQQNFRNAIDAKNQMFIRSVLQASKSNALDLFLENINSLKEMDVQGVKERLNLSTDEEAQNVLDKVDTLVQRANGVAKTYTDLQKLLPNPYPTVRLKTDPGTGNVLSTPEEFELYTRKKAWDNMLEGLTTFHATHSDNLRRLENMQKTVGKMWELDPLIKGNSQDFSLLMVDSQLESEIDLLQSQISNLKSSTDKADIERVDALNKKYEILVKYQNNMLLYKTPVSVLMQQYIEAGSVKKGGVPIYKEDYDALSDAEKTEINEKLLEFIKSSKENVLDKLQENFIEFAQYMRRPGALMPEAGLTRLWDHLRDYIDLSIDTDLMAKAIEINSSFDTFVANAERNYAFMQELYDRRFEDNEEFIKLGLKQELANAFLNHIADKYDLYVSPEQFAQFLEDGTGITFFISEKDKTLIDESNPMFSDYMQYFRNLKEVYDATAAKEEAGADTTADVEGETIPDITDEEKDVSEDSKSMVDSYLTSEKIDELSEELGTIDEVLKELETKLEC